MRRRYQRYKSLLGKIYKTQDILAEFFPDFFGNPLHEALSLSDGNPPSISEITLKFFFYEALNLSLFECKMTILSHKKPTISLINNTLLDHYIQPRQWKKG